LEEKPATGFEIDTLKVPDVKSGAFFRKTGIHFCGMRAINVPNVEGKLPARSRGFLPRRSLEFADL
jgi:hypothetical protein